jgi:hypothetical protein
MEKQMIKMTYMSAALIAATVFAAPAMAARHDVATRHATAKAHASALRVLVQQHQHQGRQIVVARLRCHPSIEEESHVKQQADQNR